MRREYTIKDSKTRAKMATHSPPDKEEPAIRWRCPNSHNNQIRKWNAIHHVKPGSALYKIHDHATTYDI